MKFAKNAILAAISFQLAFGAFPVSPTPVMASAAPANLNAEPTLKYNQKVMTISSAIKLAKQQADTLVEIGCLKAEGNTLERVNQDEEVTITSSFEIQQKEGLSVKCNEAVNFLYDLKDKIDDSLYLQEQALKNNCADCGVRPDANTENYPDVPSSEAVCSDSRRARIKAESCSFSCIINNALSSVSGGVIRPMKASASCPGFKGTNCFAALWKGITSSSLGTTFSALGAGVKSLFTAHKEEEKRTTNTAHLFSSMSDKDFNQVKVSKEEAGTWLGRRIHDLANFFLNWDQFAADIDIFRCSTCADKPAAFCRAIGTLGSDFVMIWLTGKLFGKALKGLGKGAAFVGKKTGLNKAVSGLGKRMAARGFVGRVSDATLKSWKWLSARIPAPVKKGAKVTGKVVNKLANITYDFPESIYVAAKRGIGPKLRALSKSTGILKGAAEKWEEKALKKKLNKEVAEGMLKKEVQSLAGKEKEEAVLSSLPQKDLANHMVSKSNPTSIQGIGDAVRVEIAEQQLKRGGVRGLVGKEKTSVELNIDGEGVKLTLPEGRTATKAYAFNDGKGVAMKLDNGDVVIHQLNKNNKSVHSFTLKEKDSPLFTKIEEARSPKQKMEDDIFDKKTNVLVDGIDEAAPVEKFSAEKNGVEVKLGNKKVEIETPKAIGEAKAVHQYNEGNNLVIEGKDGYAIHDFSTGKSHVVAEQDVPFIKQSIGNFEKDKKLAEAIKEHGKGTGLHFVDDGSKGVREMRIAMENLPKSEESVASATAGLQKYKTQMTPRSHGEVWHVEKNKPNLAGISEAKLIDPATIELPNASNRFAKGEIKFTKPNGDEVRFKTNANGKVLEVHTFGDDGVVVKTDRGYLIHDRKNGSYIDVHNSDGKLVTDAMGKTIHGEDANLVALKQVKENLENTQLANGEKPEIKILHDERGNPYLETTNPCGGGKTKIGCEVGALRKAL